MTCTHHEQSAPDFQHHLARIPHVTAETDTDRYLRAFDRMLVEAPPSTPDEDWLVEAARDAIRSVSDDAFRLGFEACHANVVEPLREVSVSREAAAIALGVYGARVRQGIAARFEDGYGVPTQLSTEIDEMPMPPTKGLLE